MSRQRPRHTVAVTIAGEKHVLRSDAPPEYTQAVARHVDETVDRLGDAQPLQPHRTAILAALFITDELFRARQEIARLRDELERRAAALAGHLETALAPDGWGVTFDDEPAAEAPADTAPDPAADTARPVQPVVDLEAEPEPESAAEAEADVEAEPPRAPAAETAAPPDRPARRPAEQAQLEF